MNIKTKYLFPGMESKEEVINDKDEIILFKGTLLSSKDIKKLEDNNIESIEIVINNSNETFNSDFKLFMKDAIRRYDIEKLKYIASLFETIYIDRTITYDMSNYKGKKFDIYDHIVNLTLYATTVAYLYNITNDEEKNIDLNVLALSCMLSKYGYECKEKVIFDNLKSHMTYWDKNAFPHIKAEDFYTYNDKCHTLYAYLLLQDYDIDNNVRENVLLSSEYFNNELSPLGAQLKDYGFSSDVAALISVADTFDMLLIKDSMNDKDPYKDVIIKINEYTSLGYLNPFWVKYILLDLPLYREGDKVLLSDGTIAKVESYDSFNALKPKLIDLEGNKIEYKDKLKIVKTIKNDDTN